MHDEDFNPRQRALIATQARAQLVGMTGAMPCHVWRLGEGSSPSYVLIGKGIVMFDGADFDDEAAAPLTGEVVAVVEPRGRAKFAVQAADMVMAMPGAGIVIPYTVAGPVEGSEAEWPFLRSWRLVLDSDLLEDCPNDAVTAAALA